MVDGTFSSKQPIPVQQFYPLTFFQTLCYVLYWIVTTPIKRLLGGKPPVDGWSIRTEIATKRLALVSSAEMTSARKVNSYFTYLGNLTLKTRLTPLKTDTFEAIWFGDGLNDASDANLLYIHGGGFVWCHAETNAQGVVGMLSNAKSQYSKTVVALGLDYQLAPEAKFPSQLHEALAAYEYLTTRSSKPILLLGDSAGGNLVLSLLLALKLPENKHLRRPAAVVAVSPWCQLDFSNIAPSYTKNQKSDYCGAGRLSHYVGGYVGSASVEDPLVSPIRGDFRGCCPILIHYGGKEVFEDDIEALVGVLKEQQVDVTAVKNPLAPHDTPMTPALYGDMALSGGQVIAAFLAKHA